MGYIHSFKRNPIRKVPLGGHAIQKIQYRQACSKREVGWGEV